MYLNYFFLYNTNSILHCLLTCLLNCSVSLSQALTLHKDGGFYPFDSLPYSLHALMYSELSITITAKWIDYTIQPLVHGFFTELALTNKLICSGILQTWSCFNPFDCVPRLSKFIEARGEEDSELQRCGLSKVVIKVWQVPPIRNFPL